MPHTAASRMPVLVARGCEALGVGLGVDEAERIDRFEPGVALLEAVRRPGAARDARPRAGGSGGRTWCTRDRSCRAACCRASPGSWGTASRGPAGTTGARGRKGSLMGISRAPASGLRRRRRPRRAISAAPASETPDAMAPRTAAAQQRARRCGARRRPGGRSGVRTGAGGSSSECGGPWQRRSAARPPAQPGGQPLLETERRMEAGQRALRPAGRSSQLRTRSVIGPRPRGRGPAWRPASSSSRYASTWMAASSGSSAPPAPGRARPAGEVASRQRCTDAAHGG